MLQSSSAFMCMISDTAIGASKLHHAWEVGIDVTVLADALAYQASAEWAFTSSTLMLVNKAQMPQGHAPAC